MDTKVARGALEAEKIAPVVPENTAVQLSSNVPGCPDESAKRLNVARAEDNWPTKAGRATTARFPPAVVVKVVPKGPKLLE